MEKSKESLRSGYTTGACATAATKAALLALAGQRTIESVEIRLPLGQLVIFSVHSCSYNSAEGRASVIKDAGDDPDVTHGAEICSRVTWSERPGVQFRRGQGVGLVTRKGLPVPPGEPAINPVPRQMMTEAVLDVLRESGLPGPGVEVEISVPTGEKLAEKTFNPRLGIVGGISILGTTGIVVPYSTAAWLASVVQGIDVAVAQGATELVFSVGASGERFVRQMFPLPEVAFVQIGPFFGEALRHASSVGVAKVSLASMIGKLAKFAAGSESVHSSQSTQDFVFLAELARQAGADAPTVERITHANTAQEVSELMTDLGLDRFHELLCQQSWTVARSFVDDALDLEILLLGRTGNVLARWP